MVISSHAARHRLAVCRSQPHRHKNTRCPPFHAGIGKEVQATHCLFDSTAMKYKALRPFDAIAPRCLRNAYRPLRLQVLILPRIHMLKARQRPVDDPAVFPPRPKVLKGRRDCGAVSKGGAPTMPMRICGLKAAVGSWGSSVHFGTQGDVEHFGQSPPDVELASGSGRRDAFNRGLSTGGTRKISAPSTDVITSPLFQSGAS